MSYSNLYRQYLGIAPDEANKEYLPSSYRDSMGKNSTTTDAVNAMVGAAAPQISVPMGNERVGWFEEAASPFANLFGNKMSNALVSAVKGQLSPKSGFVSDVGRQFGMSAPSIAEAGSNFGEDLLKGLTDIDSLSLANTGLSALLGATGVGGTKVGKGVKAVGATGVAAAQGFANPVSDISALMSLFKFGSSLF